jgi:hypothetical protein
MGPGAGTLSAPAVSPAGCLKGVLVGRLEKLIGQVLVVQGSGQHHASNAEGDEDHRLIARGTPLQMCFEDLDHGLGNFAVGRLDAAGAARNIGRQSDQGAGTVYVLQVIGRQVGVDHELRKRPVGHACARGPFCQRAGTSFFRKCLTDSA